MADNTAKIHYLEDENGVKWLPVTHVRAVLDSEGTNLETKLGQKQEVLVSGTNIKTINSQSLLGEGNINVQTEITVDSTPTASSTNPVSSGGVYTSLSSKQDTIADLSSIRSGATAGSTAYQKPAGGIPDTDLSSSVQTSLGKADTAIQAHQDISGKEDRTNKVASISASSNNSQYPSAMCMYNLITALESPLDYDIVATLPSASASTMGKVYIVTGDTSSDMYVSTLSSGTYSWNQVGTINDSIAVITTGEVDSLFE